MCPEINTFDSCLAPFSLPEAKKIKMRFAGLSVCLFVCEKVGFIRVLS
jgi:hypothetical protein